MRLSSIVAVGIVACVLAAGTGYALAAPVKEVELKAPWNTLELSGSEEAIFASVGASFGRQESCGGNKAAVTAGVCWDVFASDGVWTATFDFKTEDELEHALAAWGPSEELAGSHKRKLHVWYLRAGKRHFIAQWEADGAFRVHVNQVTPIKEAVTGAMKLLGKKLAQVKAASSFCTDNSRMCQRNLGRNEIGLDTALAFVWLDGGTSRTVEVSLGCDAACKAIASRVEDVFGTPATSRTCLDATNSRYTIQTFKSLRGATAYYSGDDPVVHICAGKCELPCN